ncbi:MAG: peptide deformylase [Bacteroidales bacterium]|nr:peptide deformylase [Bacteroidales bacterium]
MKRSCLIVCSVALLLCALSCQRDPWTAWERKVITQSDSVMYVTVMPEDSVFLRASSRDIPERAFGTPELQTLIAKMLATVNDPSQGGVGIAAPQVGINRRIVCLQRLDLAGEPFEPYINIQIDSLAGEITVGQEGCLSLPGLSGMVPRHTRVHVTYRTPEGTHVAEWIDGFTAIIFQHECDHLDGTLYTDRADSVFTDAAWAAEREAFTYDRPAWWE